MTAVKNSLSERIIAADVIRIVGMLMVLLLHTVLNFTQRPDFFATKLWFLLEPVVALSKSGVLLFFMLSGYLVITKHRSVKENWQKTRDKIGIPLLFFSIINIISDFIHFTYDPSKGITFFQMQLVRVTSFPSSPLWFLIVLGIFYLLNPLWQKMFENDEDGSVAKYVTGLSLLFVILTTIIKFPSMRNESFFNVFTGWIGFLFFYLYGGLVKKNWVNTRRKQLNIALVIIGLIITIIGDYYTYYAVTHHIPFTWSGYFFDYLSVPIVMMSVGLFNLLITTSFEKTYTSFILWLSGLSFGIYLIHPYIVTILIDNNFDFNKAHLNVYIYNLLNFGLVFGISLLLTVLLKKIPKVKMLIGA